MKIILKNGTELQALVVTGASRYVQGANRDCLSFVFDETASMDELDRLFTEANCESIAIVDEILAYTTEDGEVYEEIVAVHTDYAIRAELKQSFEQVAPENANAEAQTVKRITVSMAQRTYAERKLAALAAESTDTQLAVAELAELVMGV